VIRQIFFSSTEGYVSTNTVHCTRRFSKQQLNNDICNYNSVINSIIQIPNFFKPLKSSLNVELKNRKRVFVRRTLCSVISVCVSFLLK
jgi:hypothetical protein